MLGILAADPRERTEVQRRGIGLRRRRAVEGDAAVPTHLAVEPPGRRLPPRRGRQRLQPGLAELLGPQPEFEGRLGEASPLLRIPLRRFEAPPGPGRGRGRHVRQRLLPPTSHDPILPLSLTKSSPKFVVPRRRDGGGTLRAPYHQSPEARARFGGDQWERDRRSRTDKPTQCWA